jgi:ribosomal protein L7Ae-like RNA K-turn-binding protein
VLVRGREAVRATLKKIQFVLITTDISERSRREVFEMCTEVPVIALLTTAEVEHHFGLENTKIVGFLKSPIGKSLLAEMRGHIVESSSRRSTPPPPPPPP